MGLLVGFKLRLARSTVLRRRSPGPPTPALGRRAGGYKLLLPNSTPYFVGYCGSFLNKLPLPKKLLLFLLSRFKRYKHQGRVFKPVEGSWYEYSRRPPRRV